MRYYEVTLPDGGIEKYHYDACGRLRELITGEQKTSYGYDKAGRKCYDKKWKIF